EVLRRAAGFPGALSGARYWLYAAACEGRAGADAVRPSGDGATASGERLEYPGFLPKTRTSSGPAWSRGSPGPPGDPLESPRCAGRAWPRTAPSSAHSPHAARTDTSRPPG